MAFMKTLVVVCVLAAVADGYFGGIPDIHDFNAFPDMYMAPLPVPQPPRLPGRIQPPPLLQPPLLPVIYNHRYFNARPALHFPIMYPGLIDEGPSRTFAGISVSSSSTDQGGVTMVTVNQNGHTQTFISPSRPGGQYLRIPPLPHTFEMPHMKMPKFPEIKPIDLMAGPSGSGTFKSEAYGRTYSMHSKNGEKPKVAIKVLNFVNKNGKMEGTVIESEN